MFLIKDMDNTRIRALQDYAQELLNKDKRVFIKDINNTFYFADIILVGEETITVQCFAPTTRKDEKVTLSWNRITFLEEYKER